MHVTPYTTLACRFYETSKIQQAIKEANISDELVKPVTPEGKVLEEILAVMSGSDEVPSFSHPIKVELSGEYKYVIDTRPYVSIDRDGSFKINNPSDYKFNLIRTLLNNKWDNNSVMLLTVGEFPQLIFTRWLSTNISNRLGLNPEDQVKLTTVTMFYYYSLFRDEEFDEKDKINIVKKLSKVSYIPADISMKLIDDISYMAGIQEYIDTVKEIITNPRIDSLNVGLLLTMLSNSWFGFNAKETIAVSIEHPPTFLAIILAALESRSYRKSYLGKLVYDNDKRNIGKEFSKSIYSIVSV